MLKYLSVAHSLQLVYGDRGLCDGHLWGVYSYEGVGCVKSECVGCEECRHEDILIPASCTLSTGQLPVEAGD